MSLLPVIQIGWWNAWIFMVWLILFPFLFQWCIKEKEVATTIRTSVPMKYETAMNIASTAAVIGGVLYSIVLPLQISSPLFFIGGGMFICSFLVHLWILITLRQTPADSPFMTGPYRYSRHPIYIADVLLLSSVVLMTFSIVISLVLIICILHQLLVMPAEEQYCVEKYGKVYQEYLNNTPRLLGLGKK